MRAMEIIPAIDLRNGKCVRLYQGDYKLETIYSENPVETAMHWGNLGASRLHVVDLDGAKQGAPTNIQVLSDILSSVTTPVQFGGGIRTLEHARTLLEMGVDRLMIGTGAAAHPEFITGLCSDLSPHAIIVAVDALDGYVATDGWTKHSRISATDLILQMIDIGIYRFLYTDISKDGTLNGPDISAIRELISLKGVKLISNNY